MSKSYAVWEGSFLILATSSKEKAEAKYEQYKREGRTVHVYETTYERILPRDTSHD